MVSAAAGVSRIDSIGHCRISIKRLTTRRPSARKMPRSSSSTGAAMCRYGLTRGSSIELTLMLGEFTKPLENDAKFGATRRLRAGLSNQQTIAGGGTTGQHHCIRAGNAGW